MTLEEQFRRKRDIIGGALRRRLEAPCCDNPFSCYYLPLLSSPVAGDTRLFHLYPLPLLPQHQGPSPR